MVGFLIVLSEDSANREIHDIIGLFVGSSMTAVTLIIKAPNYGQYSWEPLLKQMNARFSYYKLLLLRVFCRAQSDIC